MVSASVTKFGRTYPRFDIMGWGLRFSALTYLVVMIAIPVFVVYLSGFREGWTGFWANITNPAALAALRLTIQTSAIMAVVNVVMGTLTAYVLVAYDFPGKSLFNLLIDLPFAIPTLVTGVMLVLLYGPQTAIGGFFEDTWGIRILFAQLGIVLALLFLGYPFVIRAVQPVLEQLDITQQEAAHTLGASGFRTFWRVIFPAVRPAILASGLLSFARALGEFGAIIIVSGNIPLRTQTASVYIYGQIEAGDVAAASGVSVVLLFVALAATLLVDWNYKGKINA
jgi:sulfate/thiosulfate transport system permease protein